MNETAKVKNAVAQEYAAHLAMDKVMRDMKANGFVEVAPGLWEKKEQNNEA